MKANQQHYNGEWRYKRSRTFNKDRVNRERERERESLVAYLYLKEKRVKRPRGKEVKVEERNREAKMLRVFDLVTERLKG